MCTARRGGPRTLSRTTGANYDCAFVKNTLLHQSLIVKSQKKKVGLVIRPGLTSVRVILLRRCVALNISVHGLQGHINGTSVDGDDSDVEGVGGPNGGGGYHRDDEDDRHRSLAVTEIGVIPPPPMFRYFGK